MEQPAIPIRNLFPGKVSHALLSPPITFMRKRIQVSISTVPGDINNFNSDKELTNSIIAGFRYIPATDPVSGGAVKGIQNFPPATGSLTGNLTYVDPIVAANMTVTMLEGKGNASGPKDYYLKDFPLINLGGYKNIPIGGPMQSFLPRFIPRVFSWTNVDFKVSYLTVVPPVTVVVPMICLFEVDYFPQGTENQWLR